MKVRIRTYHGEMPDDLEVVIEKGKAEFQVLEMID